jgi:hypothetical protein
MLGLRGQGSNDGNHTTIFRGCPSRRAQLSHWRAHVRAKAQMRFGYSEGKKVAHIAKELGIGRGSVYRALADTATT